MLPLNTNYYNHGAVSEVFFLFIFYLLYPTIPAVVYAYVYEQLFSFSFHLPAFTKTAGCGRWGRSVALTFEHGVIFSVGNPSPTRSGMGRKNNAVRLPSTEHTDVEFRPILQGNWKKKVVHTLYPPQRDFCIVALAGKPVLLLYYLFYFKKLLLFTGKAGRNPSHLLSQRWERK